jgi:hypothetical protein
MASVTRPVTSDSNRASSLRQAVLGAVKPEEGIEETRKQSMVHEAKPEIKKSEEKRATKGYSGAWP